MSFIFYYFLITLLYLIIDNFTFKSFDEPLNNRIVMFIYLTITLIISMITTKSL